MWTRKVTVGPWVDKRGTPVNDLGQRQRHEMMNGSMPYDPSDDNRTSWTVRTRFVECASPCSPHPGPLPWERGNPALPPSKTQRRGCLMSLPNDRTYRWLFPLPVGEGQGEGN